MLLPFECVAYRSSEGKILPSWLSAADEPFVVSILERVSAFTGLPVGEAEAIAPRILAQAAREAKMPLRIAEAVWLVERRRWEARIDALVPPEALRDELFELAARLPRDSAIAEAAQKLGLPSEVVVGTLFADRQSRRVLVAPEQPASPADVIARYNLALAQSLLARSMEVEATIAGDVSAVAAAAKRDGLLARFDLDGERVRLVLAGPLSIFHDTAKYGRMIARFVPSLLSAPSWSLRARVTLGSTSGELTFDHAGAIVFAANLPAAPDGRLARRVGRALRSAGVRVDLHPPIVRAGASLVLPDFALEWTPRRRVLVDVVPFATPEYLAWKLAAISALDEPMLVCIDARFVSLDSPLLVPFQGEIDAFALYAAALRAAESWVTPVSGAWPSDAASSSKHASSPETAPSQAFEGVPLGSRA